MHWLSKRRIMVLMILPTLALYLLFIIIPVFVTIFYSFTKFSGIGSPEFLGFTNYTNLFQDKFFFIALKNSVIILLCTVVVLIPGSFGLALLLEKPFRGNNLIKAMDFSPNVIAPILVGLMWVFILDPHMGSGQCLSTANRAGKLAAGVDRRPNPDSLLCSFGLYLAGAWVLCYDFLGWFKNNLSGYL